MSNKHPSYYVPAQSNWPILGAFALFMIAVGAGMTVQGTQIEGPVGPIGNVILIVGFVTLLYMLAGWFSNVITESLTGKYSEQIARSFRQGMSWFIFSEVMFFGAFFGALFYARMVAVPWLGGADNNAMTHEILWPSFEALWPLTTTPSGQETQAMPWQGIPLVNTIILLTSSITLHLAHTSLEKNQRMALIVWLEITIVLAGFFLFYQVEEYAHAYQEMGLTLQSGIYGNTFFLLTGFHGMHVFLGTTFLIVLLGPHRQRPFYAKRSFRLSSG